MGFSQIRELSKSKNDDQSKLNIKQTRNSKSGPRRISISRLTSALRQPLRPLRPEEYPLSRVPDVLPLPLIPCVSSTLRGELACFQPIPDIYTRDDDTNSGVSGSLEDVANSQANENAGRFANVKIRRKPGPSICDGLQSAETEGQEQKGDEIASRSSTPWEPEKSRKDEKTNDAQSQHDIDQEAGLPSSRPYHSLYEFPVPPGYPLNSLQLSTTSRPSAQVRQTAVFEALTAVAPQEALLDCADPYGPANDVASDHATTTTSHSRGSSGEISNTRYTRLTQEEELVRVEAELESLQGVVQGARQLRWEREAHQQDFANVSCVRCAMLRTQHDFILEEARALIETEQIQQQRYRHQAQLTQVVRARDNRAIAAKFQQDKDALLQAQRDAWTYKHLVEEGQRTLAVSQSEHNKTNDAMANLRQDLNEAKFRLFAEKTVSERLLADSMHANASLKERVGNLELALSSSDDKDTQLAKLLDEKTALLLKAEENAVKADRARQREADSVKAVQSSYEDLEMSWDALEIEKGAIQAEFDLAQNDIAHLTQALGEAEEKSKAFEKNAGLWQKLAETRFKGPAEQADVKRSALGMLRKELDAAKRSAQEYKERNKIVREDAADLHYELDLHKRRLNDDAICANDFYRRHWDDVDRVFDENKTLKTTVEAFQARFAEELKSNPLQLLRSPKDRRALDGPPKLEDIAQGIALYKGFDGMGDDNDSQLEAKVQGVYGFGPAGPPQLQDMPEMPEGYEERKSERLRLENEGTEVETGVDQWEDVESSQVEMF